MNLKSYFSDVYNWFTLLTAISNQYEFLAHFFASVDFQDNFSVRLAEVSFQMYAQNFPQIICLAEKNIFS